MKEPPIMTLRQDVSNISPQDDRARVDRELAYLRNVADGDPERIWGWDTPAGRIRAQRRAALISDGAHLAPGVRVLEIGCGTGLFTEMLARSGAKIFALDLSAELLAHARGRCLSRDQVQFVV